MIRVSATFFAKEIVDGGIFQRIIRHCLRLVLIGEVAKLVGPHLGSPESKLSADGAVAFSGAFGEVDVRLKFDRATDAASVIRLRHCFLQEKSKNLVFCPSSRIDEFRSGL